MSLPSLPNTAQEPNPPAWEAPHPVSRGGSDISAARWYSFSSEPNNTPELAVQAHELRTGRRPTEIWCNAADLDELRAALPGYKIIVPSFVIQPQTLRIPLPGGQP